MRDLPQALLDLEHRHELRKLLHGYVLATIANQVAVRQDDGTTRHYCIAVWKDWFKGYFLGGRSTESIDNVEFATFVLLVESHAATEMGVTFL